MRGLSQGELRNLILSVGTHRNERPLTPPEVGELLHNALASGATRGELKGELQIGSTAIARFLRLRDLTADVRHLADWGGSSKSGIAFSTLAEIARLPQHDQEQVAKAVLEHDLTWNEVLQIVQVAQRTEKPIREVVEGIMKLRTQVERRHVFIGAVEAPDLQARLTQLSQVQRDQVFRRALDQLSGRLPQPLDGRLGPQRFTIVGPFNPAAVLNVSADQFQSQLNEILRSEIDERGISD